MVFSSFTLHFSKNSTDPDKTLNLILKILQHSNHEQFLHHNLYTFFEAVIKILFHYNNKFYDRENNCRWKYHRKLQQSRHCYNNLLKTYIPFKKVEVVTTIINIINQNQFWDMETLCIELFYDLIKFGINGATVVNVIYDEMNTKTINAENTRILIRILYSILDVYKWPKTRDTQAIVERTLKLFYKSIINERISATDVTVSKYKTGLEVCVRNIIKNLPNDHLLLVIQNLCSWTLFNNVNDRVILDFSSVLEYAAYLYRTELYQDTLTPKVFPLLMKMISSKSKLLNILGNRVIQYLIDRQDNKLAFDTPKIFYEDTNFDLKLGPYKREDKHFLKIYREILHDSLLKSLLNHASSTLNLKTTYCTICLIAIEVPCGFSAAAIVCLLMNVQDIILEDTDTKRPTVIYHLHATILSIMSLLCWIHNAKVFYEYVNSIVTARAEWAPHLNPPLQSKYSFSIHHVSWNKPELFFIDWETRYGLWKCFRLHEE